METELIQMIRQKTYYPNATDIIHDNMEQFVNTIRVINDNKKKFRITSEEIMLFLHNAFHNLLKEKHLTSGHACAFKIMCDLGAMNIDNNIAKYFITEFFLNEEECNKVLLLKIPKSAKFLIRCIQLIKNLILLIECENNNIKTPKYFELMTEYGEKFCEGFEVDIIKCFNGILEVFKLMHSRECLIGDVFYCYDIPCGISGYLFHKLSELNTGRRDLADGVFKLLRYLNGIDPDFEQAFKKFFKREHSHIIDLCHPNNISILLEDVLN